MKVDIHEMFKSKKKIGVKIWTFYRLAVLNFFLNFKIYLNLSRYS